MSISTMLRTSWRWGRWTYLRVHPNPANEVPDARVRQGSPPLLTESRHKGAGAAPVPNQASHGTGTPKLRCCPAQLQQTHANCQQKAFRPLLQKKHAPKSSEPPFFREKSDYNESPP